MKKSIFGTILVAVLSTLACAAYASGAHDMLAHLAMTDLTTGASIAALGMTGAAPFAKNAVIRGIQAVRMDASNPKEVLAELQKAWHDFKAENDKQIAELKKGVSDPLQASKVENINAAVSDMQKQLGGLVEKVAAFELGGGSKGSDPTVEAHAKGFNAYFRKGAEAGLRDLEVNARLTTQSDPDGGFIVPREMESSIDRVLGTMSAMRSLATVRQIGAAGYKKLVSMGGATSGWVGENGSRTETGTPSLKGLDFPVLELFAQPGATQTMLDDAAMNIEAWLADEVAIEFAEQEGEAFISGNGVSRPRGILSYDMVANASYAWGKVGFIKSAGASDFAASNPADAFIDLVHSLKKGYRQNASFLTNDLTVSKVRKFKDGQGNYLWQPSAQAGQPSTFLGYVCETDDNMPDVGANAFPVLFADFKRAYLILDRVGIRVLRDPFTSKPNILFYTTKRVGGGIQNFEAVKAMKIAA